ncbi:b117 [Murid betaherpesvirus 8]|uniref:B117 n=1 Tax=Rat cytomegalovirus (isolate England) TaxID=1261657 RepID=A0A0E3SY99_RCMVE|nr:b117 [Murid betaherpesvirus 8]WPH25019.1 b117 [Murid betaherpesvirus 8]WPH25153.1 b117 [Murid betaherpesvirus 8]
MSSKDIVLPPRSMWSNITYVKVSHPTVSSLSPANVSNDRLIIARPIGTSFIKIPPGESPWENRVRIISSDVNESHSEADSVPTSNYVPGSCSDRLYDPVSQSVSSDNTQSVYNTESWKDVEDLIKGEIKTDFSDSDLVIDFDIIPSESEEDIELSNILLSEAPQKKDSKDKKSNTDEGVIRKRRRCDTGVNTSRDVSPDAKTKKTESDLPQRGTDATEVTSNIIVIPVTRNTDNPTTEPVLIPKIVIPDLGSVKGEEEIDAMLPNTDDPELALSATEGSYRNNKILNDIVRLCETHDNVLDIQLHLTCQKFKTVRVAYNALTKIPSLYIITGSQTLTELCRCDSTERSTSEIHQQRALSNTHIEIGSYEICIRSQTAPDLLEAARVCKDISDRAVYKCELKISTSVYSYT